MSVGSNGAVRQSPHRFPRLTSSAAGGSRLATSLESDLNGRPSPSLLAWAPGCLRAGRARSDVSDDIHQHNAIPVPSEVVLIETSRGGPSPCATMVATDVRIMDLAPANWNITAQRRQFAGDIRAILQQVELRHEPAHVLQCIRHCQRRGPDLWPSYDSQILAQDLSTDSQRLGSGERSAQPCAGETVVGRNGETSPDQNVGVNEHPALSGLGRRRDPHAATTSQLAKDRGCMAGTTRRDRPHHRALRQQLHHPGRLRSESRRARTPTIPLQGPPQLSSSRPIARPARGHSRASSADWTTTVCASVPDSGSSKPRTASMSTNETRHCRPEPRQETSVQRAVLSPTHDLLETIFPKHHAATIITDRLTFASRGVGRGRDTTSALMRVVRRGRPKRPRPPDVSECQHDWIVAPGFPDTELGHGVRRNRASHPRTRSRPVLDSCLL